MALPKRKPATEPNWTRVSGSWIMAVAFQPVPGSTYGTLFIWTHRKGVPGKKYGYAGVPRFVWHQMRENASKGETWWRLNMRSYVPYEVA